MSDRTEIALTLPTAEQLLKQLGTALQGAPVAQEPDGSRWIELDWLTDKICEIVKSGIRTLPANPAVKLEIGNPIILEPGLPDGEVKGLIMICDLKVQSGRATVIVGPKQQYAMHRVEGEGYEHLIRASVKDAAGHA